MHDDHGRRTLSKSVDKSTSGGYRRTCVAILVFSLVALITAIVVAIVVKSQNEKSGRKSHQSMMMMVKTDCGPIHGFVETSDLGNSAFVFKGIPFAKPPTGRRRWKPPEDLSQDKNGQCWEGTFEATKYAPSCPQSVTIVGPGPITGNEDCLYLNIWTKGVPTKLRPVLLWVHGGGFLGGSPSIPGYAPNSDVVNSMDVVAVSTAYRLNLFGFLALDVLAKNSSTNSSGNYGIMDVIKALQWINKNIKAFGGDPKQVTVLGHSAGAKVLYALLASPMANGLFHKAIALSGPPVYTRTWKQAAKANSIYVDRANCSKSTTKEILDCLYQLTTKEAFDAIPWFVYPFWSLAGGNDLPTRGEKAATLAVIDGHVVPVSPLDLANQTTTKIKPVPILISTVAQECELATSRNLTKKTFRSKVNETLGSFSKNIRREALEIYLPNNETEAINYGLTYINMSTDVRVSCPNNVFGKNLSRVKHQNVYRLVIDDWPSNEVNFGGDVKKYSFHAWDVFALFNFQLPMAGDFGPKHLYKPTDRDLKFKEFLEDEYFHFMEHGHPKTKGWKKYPERVAVYKQGTIGIQKTDYREKQCEFWNSHGFFPYGWML